MSFPLTFNRLSKCPRKPRPSKPIMGRRITRAFSKDLKSLTIKIVKVNNESYKVLHDNDDVPNENKLPPRRNVRDSIGEDVKPNDCPNKFLKADRNNDGEASFDNLRSCVNRRTSDNLKTNVKPGGDATSSDVGCKKLKYLKTFKGEYKYRSIVQELRLVRKRTKSSLFRIRKDKSKCKVPRVVKIKSRTVDKTDRVTEDNNPNGQIVEEGERVFNSPTVRTDHNDNSDVVHNSHLRISDGNKSIFDCPSKRVKHGEGSSNTIVSAVATSTYRYHSINKKSVGSEVIQKTLTVAAKKDSGTVAIWQPTASNSDAPEELSHHQAEMDNQDIVPIDYSSGSNMATSPGPLTPPSTPKRNYKKQLLQLHQQQEAAAQAAEAAALLETRTPALGESSRTTSKMSTSVVSRKRTVSERDGPSILERVPQVPPDVFIPDLPNDDSEPIRQRLKKQGNEKISLGPNRLLLRNELLHIKKVQNEVHCSMITPPAEEDNADSSGFDYLSNLEAISDEETSAPNNKESSDLVLASEIATLEEDIDTTLRWRPEWMQSSKRCVKIQRKLQELLHLMYQKIYCDQNRTYNYNNPNRTSNHSNQLVADDESKSLKKVILDLSLLQRYNYLYPDWEIAFVGKVQLLLEHLEMYEKKKFKDSRTRQHLFMTIILYILEHNLILPKVLDVYPHLLFARYEVLFNIRNRIRYDCENFPGNSAEATDTLPLPETSENRPAEHTQPSNTPALNYTQSHQRGLVGMVTEPPLRTSHPIANDSATQSSILNQYHSDRTEIPQVRRSNIVQIETPPPPPPIHNLQIPPTIQQVSSMLSHFQSYRTEIPQVRRSNIVELETDTPQINNLQITPTIQQMSSLLNHYQSYRTEIPQVRRSNIVELETDAPMPIHNPQIDPKMQQVSVIKSTALACKEFKYEPKPGWITKAEIIPYLNGDYLVLHPAKRRRIVRTYKPIIVLSDSDDSDDEDRDVTLHGSGEEKSAKSSETLLISAGTNGDGNNSGNKTINTYSQSTSQTFSEEGPKFNYTNKEPTNNLNSNDQINVPSSSVNPVGTGFDQTSALYRQEASMVKCSVNQASKNQNSQFSIYNQTNRPQIQTHNGYVHPTVPIHSVPSATLRDNPLINCQRQQSQITINNFRNINSLIAAKEIPPLVPNGGPIIYQRSLSDSSSNTVLDSQSTSQQIEMHPLAGTTEQHTFNERARQYGQTNGSVRASSGEMLNPQTFAPREPVFIFQRQLSQLSNSSSGDSVNGDRPATLHPQGYVLEMKNVEEMNIPEDFKSFYEFVTKSQITNGNEPIRFTTFLELHNAGNLKTYQKKYVEYLKMKERNDC